MAPYSIEEPHMIVSPIAQAHGVESVSLFGPYSNGTADAHSDVDLKIEKGEDDRQTEIAVSCATAFLQADKKRDRSCGG